MNYTFVAKREGTMAIVEMEHAPVLVGATQTAYFRMTTICSELNACDGSTTPWSWKQFCENDDGSVSGDLDTVSATFICHKKTPDGSTQHPENFTFDIDDMKLSGTNKISNKFKAKAQTLVDSQTDLEIIQVIAKLK